MPIEKQPVNINFALGVDQKTDPFQIKPGRFLSLKNRVFTKGGRLDKRFGYTALAKTVTNDPGFTEFNLVPSSVAVGRGLANFNSELVLADGLQLYSYAPTADKWSYKGRKEICSTDKQSVFKNNKNNLTQDSAYNETLGLTVYVWESFSAEAVQVDVGLATAAGVQVTAIDSVTGQVAFNASLGITTSYPKCLSIAGKLYITYVDSAFASVIRIAAVTQAGVSAAATLVSNNNTTLPIYDIGVNGSTFYIAYSGAASTVKVASFDSNASAVNSTSKAEVASNGIGVFFDASNNVWVCYNNGSNTRAFIMNSGLSATTLAPMTVIAGGGVKNVTGIHDGTYGVIFVDFPSVPRLGQQSAQTASATNFTVTASFTQPAVYSSVTATINTATPAFPLVGSVIYIPTGGYYFCSAQTAGAATITLYNLGYSGNAAPAATVASARQIISPVDGYSESSVFSQTLTLGGAAGSSTRRLPSTALASKAFIVNGAAHVICVYDSPIQNTYFVAALYNQGNSNLNAFVSAKLAESAAGGIPYRSILPAVNTISTGIFRTALLEQSFEILQTAGNTVRSSFLCGVSSFDIDFVTNDVQCQDIGNNLQIGSGSIGMYDGFNCVEHGFHIYPETVRVAATVGAGSLSTGTYGYKAIYEWIDNQGQKHRSAPSVNTSFTIATAPAAFTGDTTNASAVVINCSTVSGLQIGMAISGAGIPAATFLSSIDSATQITLSQAATATAAGVTLTPAAVSSLTINVPTLRITEKSNVTIVIYRTAANGTTYFRINPASPASNSYSSTAVAVSDTSADASISGNEQLYTGQEVENIEAPGSSIMTEYKNRLIVVPSEDPYSWWFSKQVVNGSPVEFSDLFQQNAGTFGGGLRGAWKLDDKLILFKRGEIYYVTGIGPSPSGANNDFTDPQFITADAGLEDVRSLVTTPVGIMFKSAKGIYLLDRSLQTRYIGAAVEDFNSYTVRGAQLLATKNQVIFDISSGQALVYDYYWTDESGVGQWAIFDNISNVSSLVFDSAHTFITSAGQVYKQSTSSYLDGATSVNTYFKSGWFNLAGLQGFERAYFFYFLAKYISSHTLTINIYYDYDDTTVAQTLTITPNSSDLEQWRVFLSKQKCEAFMLEVQENGSSGAGFTMSGLNLVVGLKKGYTPIKAAASAS